MTYLTRGNYMIFHLKNAKQRAKLLTTVLTLALLLFSLSSCSLLNSLLGKECTHADGDADGICDECGVELVPAPCEHKDTDYDNKCDECGEELPEEPCTDHYDGDCNGKCDNCDAAVPVEHVNSDGDHACDKCGLCLSHIDENCNGECDVCGEAVPLAHKDENNDNVCDKCNTTIAVIAVRAHKSASVAKGQSLYPTEYIAWSEVTYRGAYVTYTITVINEGTATAEVSITDLLSEHTELVSGCSSVSGNTLSWNITVPVGGEKSVIYTVAVTADESKVGAVVDGGGAIVNSVGVDCHDLYIAPSLNEVDAGYIERAIRILADSTYTDLTFAKHAYTIAFTNANAIAKLMSGTPAEVLDLIFSGTDAKLASALAPGLYGGSSVSAGIAGAMGEVNSGVAAEDLISGDIAFVKSAGGTKMFIVCGSSAYDITGRALKLSISDMLTELGGAEKYAVVRPSYTMTLFTPSDPDEIPETMNAYQEAIVKTAESYVLRGERLQYEDVNFGLTSTTGEYRWAHGQKLPEEYTYDEWGYVNCAVFTYDVYIAALGYTLPSNMYTTERLTANAAANGMSVFTFERQREDVYTAEEQLEIQRAFMQTLEPGDIMVRRHTNVSTGKTTGHAMLYVGNGRFIHSGGASYSVTSGIGSEVYEPTIRCHKVSDYLFGEATTSMFNDEYNMITVVRPLNKFTGEIPENTVARLANMQGIRAEKLSSHPSSVTVNPGDLITFTFSINNIGNVAKVIEVYDNIPAGCIYVSGGDRVEGDELFWTVSVGAGETVNVSYTVRVGELADGTQIDGNDATVGGVRHRCAAIRVKNTLTVNEQDAILAAIKELKNEGTTLTGLALVNEIYKRALGIDNVFADTNADNVMRDGSESVFATSTKKNNNKYLSKLQTTATYYSSMLVDHLYGGLRFDSSEKLYDRTRLLKEHNLVVGDVLIARSSSSVNIYIWAGDAGLILLNSGVGSAVDFTTISERILYFGRDFAVLRPSQVIG